MPERESKSFFDWPSDGLAVSIQSGRKSALEEYARKLDEQPQVMSLVRLMHPPCQRISRFRGRPIDGSDIDDIRYDLESYRGLNISLEELGMFLSAMVFLETAYYGFAEKMAAYQARLLGLDKFFFEGRFKDQIGWLVFARWNTQGAGCFFSLHKAIICELARTEYSTRGRFVWNNLSYTSYEYLPEDQEYVGIGQIDANDRKPHPTTRIREGLEGLHLAEIVSKVQRLPYFEQYCFFVALGYGINDPNVTSFKKTYGVGGNTVETAIDKAVDFVAGITENAPPNNGRSFYQIVEAAKNNALVYTPEGTRVPHTHARCRLIGRPCPEGVSGKDGLVFGLATTREGQRLVYSLTEIARVSGISLIGVEKKIRRLAKLVSDNIK